MDDGTRLREADRLRVDREFSARVSQWNLLPPTLRTPPHLTAHQPAAVHSGSHMIALQKQLGCRGRSPRICSVVYGLPCWALTHA